MSVSVPLDGVAAKLSHPNDAPSEHNANAVTTRVLKKPARENDLICIMDLWVDSSLEGKTAAPGRDFTGSYGDEFRRAPRPRNVHKCHREND